MHIRFNTSPMKLFMVINSVRRSVAMMITIDSSVGSTAPSDLVLIPLASR
jgi:hypothetical protein